MTKNMNWRLKELPDAIDVAELVDKKVITAAEARQLLFNEGKDEGKKVKELEEEVKFLRDLCDKLAFKNNSWMTIVHEYKQYKPLHPNWYGTYGGVINTLEMKPQVTFSSTAGATTTNLLTGGAFNTAAVGLGNLNKN